MPATPLDSALYRNLFGDAEIGRLFTDGAELRAMLVVLGALARAQAEQGLIPELAATAIQRASLDVTLDPAALSTATGQNGVPIPALVAAFRTAMGAPEHAQYVHWGATSQDIIDTALMLRLRQVLTILETRLIATLHALADLAVTHAERSLAARTWGQSAVPTAFGAVAAGWGAPLLTRHGQLAHLRDTLLRVSLSGAAGTLSVMGDKGPGVRAGLASGLGLADPGATWHSDRTGIATLSAWLTGTATALGRIGEDLFLMTQTGTGEVAIGTPGASSTMPQKANPVAPSALVALARTATGLDSALQGAALHRQQRDGAAWMTEWLTLPQLCTIAGRALTTAATLIPRVAPIPAAMEAALAANAGTIHAEALTFALAARMPRPEAQDTAKRLASQALTSGTPLPDLARAAFPDLPPDLFDPARALGRAPSEARAFAAAARALTPPA